MQICQPALVAGFEIATTVKKQTFMIKSCSSPCIASRIRRWWPLAPTPATIPPDDGCVEPPAPIHVLPKFIVVVNDEVNVRDWKEVTWAARWDATNKWPW